MANMRLHSTYLQETLHRDWQSTYYQSRVQNAVDNAVYTWLLRRLKPRGRWLDAGCGNGTHALRIASLGFDVTGVDISPTVLDQAREMARSHPAGDRVHFLASALENLNDVEADHVHCRGVLMHIPDWEQALKNLAAIVKPGCYLVIFESNASSIERVLVQLARTVIRASSRMEKKQEGVEFWGERNGQPFLVRIFNLP